MRVVTFRTDTERARLDCRRAAQAAGPTATPGEFTHHPKEDFMMRSLFPALLAVLATIACVPAHASDYPAKPIRLIVPFSPGGTTDVLARFVAQKTSDAMHHQIIVDNRPGANGNIGAEMVAKASPDGYTLLMGFDGTLAINPSTYRKLPFDPLKDFATVVNVARVPLLIVATPKLPASTLPELVALAKKEPGVLNFSSAGLGSTGHLAGELLKRRAGIDMVHIAYKGGGQALNDVLAGRVQLLITAWPTAGQFVRSGKLKAIAVTSATRIAEAPDVPTIAESGYPGFDVSSWYGIVAPAGTPRKVIDYLNREIVGVLKQADVKARLRSLGTEPIGGSPSDFHKTLQADTTRWAEIVRAANIHIN